MAKVGADKDERREEKGKVVDACEFYAAIGCTKIYFLLCTA